MEARENPRALMKAQKDLVNQDPYIYTIAGTRDFKSGKNFKVKKYGQMDKLMKGNLKMV